MATIIRCVAVAIVLFAVAASIAAENTAAVTKNAIDTLMTQIDGISHDHEMTTAKKAIVAGEAMEKFNQQYKGKPLSIRLKIQDVVPSDHGQYLTVNHPDLAGVQVYAGKFQSNLSSAEVMSVTKESVLVVTGMVSASSQPQQRGRLSDIVKQGSSITFVVRVNPPCQICLDNVSYQLEAVPKTRLDARPASATGGSPLGDKAKSEQVHSVDDIKLFFLKGILQSQHQYGSTNTGSAARAGTSPSPSYSTRPNSGYGSNSAYGANSSSGAVPAKVKHNRIYTATEITEKFGVPSSRSSKATAEEWIYKCKDGTVHLHFTQVGYSRSYSTSKTETLRLEIKSVDSSSLPPVGSSRY